MIKCKNDCYRYPVSQHLHSLYRYTFLVWPNITLI